MHLDPDTPVGAFGTMFWFRPKALRKLFEQIGSGPISALSLTTLTVASRMSSNG